MIIDSQNLYSDAQALTATAASANLIDHGADRDMGIGEPLALVIVADVALAGTSPTLDVAIQVDDNSSFSSATSVASYPQVTSLAAGGKIIIPLPPLTTFEQYSRVNYTLGGTSPTVTLTAFLQPMSMIQNDGVFPDGFTIS